MEPRYNLTYLRKTIQDRGYITIAEFIENVVSNYYKTANSIGQKGDFITSPEISQIFGEMIGVWSAMNWDNMGRPSKFSLVELGPGRGTLMNDLLRATKNIPGFHEAMEINLIEFSPKLTEIQSEKLSKWEKVDKIIWHTNFDIEALAKQPTLFIANEFFDALPIHQYTKIKNLWYENTVTTLTFDGEFCMSNVPSPTNIDNMLNDEHPNADHRAIIELSPSSIDIVKKICAHLNENSGYALIIDYGYDMEPSIRQSYNSTLQAVKNHLYHPILQDIGMADITSHVDFFALKQAALDSDCNIYGAISQREFLLNLGIDLRLDLLLKKLNPGKESEILKSGTNRLIAKDKMGNLFKVLSISNNQFKNNIGFDNNSHN